VFYGVVEHCGLAAWLIIIELDTQRHGWSPCYCINIAYIYIFYPPETFRNKKIVEIVINVIIVN